MVIMTMLKKMMTTMMMKMMIMTKTAAMAMKMMPIDSRH